MQRRLRPRARPEDPPLPRLPLFILAVRLLVAALCVPVAAYAQPAGRRAATLDALTASPLFFHGTDVVVQADVKADGVLAYLVGDNGARLLALDVTPPPAGTRERIEATGRFYDVGRLEPDDTRVANLPLDRLTTVLLGKPWPGVGELPVLVAASTRVVAGDGGPGGATLRALALDPAAHLDEAVTISGRFRGRNLYGDLPSAPGRSRWDFVLASVDAAVWVVGREPRGDGFELDVQARIDTGRWLEVTGRVELRNGMVLIDATGIELADPPADRQPIAPVRPREGPVPEVIFSAPLQDDVDVPADSTVRIQFSRDMDPDSFDGRVAVAYGGQDAPAAGGIGFEAAYRPRNRVLEIRFDAELERFRTIDVRLLEGITATDGVALPAWALSFFVGG